MYCGFSMSWFINVEYSLFLKPLFVAFALCYTHFCPYRLLLWFHITKHFGTLNALSTKSCSCKWLLWFHSHFGNLQYSGNCLQFRCLVTCSVYEIVGRMLYKSFPWFHIHQNLQILIIFSVCKIVCTMSYKWLPWFNITKHFGRF